MTNTKKTVAESLPGIGYAELCTLIADMCELSAQHDANGDEEFAQIAIDAVWDLRMLKQSMDRARRINLRARLGA